jgi:transcription-repair coupling factor (superfamily II helicase)
MPVPLFDYTEVMRRILQHPTATLAYMNEGVENVHIRLPVSSIERFHGSPDTVKRELEQTDPNTQIVIVCPADAEIERLTELFGHPGCRLQFIKGMLSAGFKLADSENSAETLLLSASELFERHDIRRPKRRQLSQTIDSFLDLKPGDLVVHVAHGIARFRGIETLMKGQQEEEHLHLEFADSQALYVPISKIGLVQKYVAGNKYKPKLAKIGGQLWARHKKAVQEAVFDLAAEMIELQARREAQPGTAFPPDSDWQREFDASFPFRETNDQLLAIEAVKHDMELPRPMDRLLCGDVGFGKTEVAIRAAFKAVDAGYQVSVLVPTTILAEQHARTFAERMREFPIAIAAMSRFQTKQEQKHIVEQLALGKIDIVIGTHRIVSTDIKFHNLGLVIIDEEQRFGVHHKERLKLFRDSVDVLTMTATPIPRTLHFSLLGIREISNLETPPEDRLAVETRVIRFNEEIVRSAVLRELNRGGQIYFVHNRVYDIEETARRLQHIVPECRIGIGHAQMSGDELEEVMRAFVNHEFDMLVSTTIIESGLDIPNANTMFIDEASNYGLADLHQLRGRVGRYKHQAYCYLLLSRTQSVNSTALKRLRAVEEYAHLGSGFHLAMRDLEIRGAGNILGTQQSGHIAAVGYEMYCQFLETAVRTLKRLPPRTVIDVELDLPGAALIPMSYTADQRVKIDLYRRLTRVATMEECSDLRNEMIDRFGEPPLEVKRLLLHSRIRVLAHGYRIRTIKLENGLGSDSGYAVLEYVSQKLMDELQTKLNTHGLQLRKTAERRAYVPMPANLSRNSEPDAILAFVLKVLE